MLKPEAFPQRLTLELTNRCNYRCVMCPSHLDPESSKGLMDPWLFRRLVDQTKEHGKIALVPFFRGEPLMHPQIVPLLDYAKKQGMGPIQLANNGSLMDQKTAMGLLDTGIDFISFSLDTMDSEEYLAMRRGEPLEKVVNNILGLIELRNKGNYQTEIQVSATRTDINSQSIQNFIDYWQDKVDRTRIYYEHSKDGHLGSLDCPEVPQDMERKPCQKLVTDMVVYFDGKVGICNHDWQRGDQLGDLTQNSIEQVWQSERYADLRRQHDHPSKMTDETCLHCDHWKISYLENPFIGELYLAHKGQQKACQA